MLSCPQLCIPPFQHHNIGKVQLSLLLVIISKIEGVLDVVEGAAGKLSN